MAKLVIVGGGAGGPAAATRARRVDEHAQIVMFERGEHVSYAHCGLPYYIGGVITEREKMLVATSEFLQQRYRIDVRTRTEVQAIIPGLKQVEAVNLSTGERYQEQYDRLILALGADPVRPPIPGIDIEGIFTLRNLTDGDAILKFINERQPRRAVVVGAGYIGLEMAENLKVRGMEVAVVEMLDQVLSPLDPEMARMVEEALKSNGVKVVLSDPIASFNQRGGQIIARLKSGVEIPCDMVMLALGVRPNIGLAKSTGLVVGELGGIKVNEHLQTSAPDIYAVGDAVETVQMVTGETVLMPLAGIASRQARIAVDNIYGRNVDYRSMLGTAIVKVFDTTAGGTGVNEKRLKQLGIRYAKSYLHPYAHASYYPDATQLHIKVLFSPDDGHLFGAQVVGNDGVDKRIDIFATAIIAGMTVSDLTRLELAYVPQYGTAKDAVNMAGYVASNIISGDAPTVCWDELVIPMPEKATLLDVRNKDEIEEKGAVTGAKHIPLNELRDRLDELPQDHTIYQYCAAGLRSYIGTRILRQRGFDAKNISGGFTSYQAEKKPRS